MNGPSCANNAPSLGKHDACIQKTGIEYGIVYCQDGTTHSYLDDYPRKLRAAVKLAAQIFSGRRMFFSEQDLDDLVGRLKLCRTLPSPDYDVVSVIDVLLCRLLSSNFTQLVHAMADRREMDIFIHKLFERVCHEGDRAQAVARAMEWQRKSSADAVSARHAVEAAFSSNMPVFSHKMSLLRKTFVPANEEAAHSVYESVRANEALFQQAMSGEVPHRTADTLHRPHIALIQNDLHALQDGLDSAASIKDMLRGGVITVAFSRVHGFYLSVVLLADGRRHNALKDLAEEVSRLWDGVADGDGYVHQWSEPQCSWCGLIEPNDTAKKTSLMLELECRALREKYVRPKGSEALPTFTPIQPALVGAQRMEGHYA